MPDLGYAGIAGVPLQNGLAAAAGALITLLASRQISTGPVSSPRRGCCRIMLVTGLGGDQRRGSVAITLLTGRLFLCSLRSSSVSAQFLSKAVVTGFSPVRRSTS